MTKEIYHEGWLIKSPPTKRIWRARWHKRWFTLKQGEIPEQFCLEYYTNSDCSKLKGVIDLDQCEQVDSGLQMEHRKVKFRHMFDVKTPRRTYYLAADSEEDMNAWVNCICEVCNLQDLSKPQSPNTSENRQYYNVKAELVENQSVPSTSSSTTSKPMANTKSANASDQVALLPTAEPIDSNNSVYQNFDPKNRASSYTNRETIICDAPLSQNAELSKDIRRNTNDMKEHYYNFTVIANTSSSDGLSTSNKENDTSSVRSFGEHRVIGAHATVPRKIPENLKLNNTISNDATTYASSPALSTSSGPYIAISECISGNPIIDRDNPMTPLNSLDPKFYDTPRSHFNIGLNLTNEQPYSPKRNNLSTLTTSQQILRSGKSSPTDSESVFTDDDEWLAANPNNSVGERSMRPSESSVENDQIVFTYVQRFSKLPDDEISTRKTKSHSKRTNPVYGLCLENSESEDQNKDINSSDTENASPAIAYGPKDSNSCVDESYDIPRSHQIPYMRCNNDGDAGEASSTLNRISMTSAKLDDGRFSNRTLSNSNLELHSATLPTRRPHCYTNAAPTKIEGNVFRYDFDEKSDAPAVDRKLKPKPQIDDGDFKLMPNKTLSTTPSPNGQSSSEFKPPPCVDRKLKPSTPIKLETSTLQRRTIPNEIVHFRSNSEQISRTLPRYNNSASFSGTITSPTSTQSIQNVGGKPPGGLEYFDLDHSNPPPICNNSNTSASTSNLSANIGTNFAGSSSATNLSHRFSTVGISTPSIYGAKTIKSDLTATNSLNAGGASASAIGEPSVVYKQVDFIKTEAFMRTRQDAELARSKNRSKE